MDPQYPTPYPGPAPEHTDHRTVDKPGRHARKITSDLIKTARLYDGVQLRLYSIRKDSARCTECTNMITGEQMVSTCAVCDGTGYMLKVEVVGDYWANATFMPRVKQPSDNGNTDNPGIRDQITVIGAPLIEAGDLLITIDSKEVFKVLDQEPQVVAAGGQVITQIVNCSRLTPGSREYDLIDW